MTWEQKCGVVIPCLNEAATIAALISEVRAYLPAVWVVDDGSGDGTADLAAAAGAMVLRHDTTQGKGAALQAGLGCLARRGYEWGLTMDGDGQHAPADIPAFLRRAEDSGAALVVGNRMLEAQRMPWLRRQVNGWMSRRLSAMAGRPLPDSQCGFRLLRLPLWASLDLRCRRFETESEMLLAFINAGCAVDFVPITVIYKGERSKIHPLEDSWRWLCWWWRMRTMRGAAKKVEPMPVPAR